MKPFPVQRFITWVGVRFILVGLAIIKLSYKHTMGAIILTNDEDASNGNQISWADSQYSLMD